MYTDPSIAVTDVRNGDIIIEHSTW